MLQLDCIKVEQGFLSTLKLVGSHILGAFIIEAIFNKNCVHMITESPKDAQI